jgi:hypothetical protein
MKDFFIGDRVSREIYLDDGTWNELGDVCLPSPLKYGTVSHKEWDCCGHRYIFSVKWNSGKEQHSLLAHGLNEV